jgi:hypothetical protein
MSEIKHTPTPWHINKKRGDCGDGPYNYAVLTNEEGNIIIDCYNSEVVTLCEESDGEGGYYRWDARGEADISYALESVNNHERLTQRVEELEKALYLSLRVMTSSREVLLAHGGDEMPTMNAVIDLAKAALAGKKVGEKS